MGKPRPEREKTMQAWLASGGERTAKSLAEEFGVSENMIRKWKSQDQWNLKLKKPRGAPVGNQNAKGHGAPEKNQNAKSSGAPVGNQNAKTHGAYAEPDRGNFTEQDWEEVRRAADLSAELGALTEKRIDLEKKIAALEAEPADKFDTGGVDVVKGKSRRGSVVYWEGKFQRQEKLEARYNQVIKNIMKIKENLQKDSCEKMRIDLERERMALAREKAMGIFEEEK